MTFGPGEIDPSALGKVPGGKSVLRIVDESNGSRAVENAGSILFRQREIDPKGPLVDGGRSGGSQDCEREAR